MSEVVDVDMSQIAFDLGDALSSLAGLVRFIAKDRNTPRMREAFQDAIADWAIEARQQTIAQARQLAAKASDVAELGRRLEALVEDPEFVRVCCNYGYEACREAIDERRRMLAFAEAGSLTLDLTVAQVARVERTIRGLDPADLRHLQRVAKIANPPKPPHDERQHYNNQLQSWREQCGRQAQARFEVLKDCEALAVLSAAGCILVALDAAGYTPRNSVTVTDLGLRVLHVLHGYLLATEESHG